MSELIELFTFFSFCITQIFDILENTYLGVYSILDIIIALGYLSITMWGIFEIISYSDNSNNGN